MEMGQNVDAEVHKWASEASESETNGTPYRLPFLFMSQNGHNINAYICRKCQESKEHSLTKLLL